MGDAILKCGPHPKWEPINRGLYYGGSQRGAYLTEYPDGVWFRCWDGRGFLRDCVVSELQAVVLATQDPEETIRRYAERKGGGA